MNHSLDHPHNKSTVSESELNISKKRIKTEEGSISRKEISSKMSDELKQEKNRLCARKCRMKKKEYVKNLEDEIERLRNELSECRKELCEYKNKEKDEFASQFPKLETPIKDTKINSGDAIRIKPKKILKEYMVI